MSGIEVVEPGLQTTVQDRGRPGQARLGISAAGAADPLALDLANRLAGNPPGAAALEMALLGGSFRFDAPALVALAGADMRAEADGLPFAPFTSRRVRAGGLVRCGAAVSGARTYLAVAGGIDTPPFLGSRSTHLPSRLGGLEGRALRRGDRLAIGAPPGARTADAGPASLRDRGLVAPAAALRVTAGAQADRFDAETRRLLEGAEFTVSAASDRMGLRLEGPPLPAPGGGRMASEGMPLGALQVPPDGQPILLFVDHQTTGGYPVIATVIGADLWRAGQLRPGARVRFEAVAMETARALLLEQRRRLRSPDLLAGAPAGPGTA